MCMQGTQSAYTPKLNSHYVYIILPEKEKCNPVLFTITKQIGYNLRLNCYKL